MSNKSPINTYTRKDSKWYWFTFYDENGKRIHKSAKKLGIDIKSHTATQANREICRSLNINTNNTADAPVYLADIYDWLLPKLIQENIRASSISQYDVAIRHLIDCYGQGHRTIYITKQDVSVIRTYLLSINLKPVTTDKILRLLRAVFGRMFDDGIVDRNPFSKFKEIGDNSNLHKSLSKAELNRFVESCESDTGYIDRAHVARLLAFTGRRLTEILYIERSDIDLSNMRLLVSNVKNRKGQKQWIIIPSVLYNDVTWLYNNTAGDQPFKVCVKETMSKWIKKHLVKIGRPDLYCHCLRHTFITLAGLNGTNLLRLQQHVGHSTIRTTERYFHGGFEDAINLDLGEQEVVKKDIT